MTSPEQRELASHCTRLEYHRSHAIQPHFVLVVLDAGLRILRVTENAEGLLGLAPRALIGRDFLDLVEGNLRGAVASLGATSRGRLALELVVRRGQRRTDALLFRSGGLLCCELELATAEDRALPLLALQAGAQIVDSETDPEALATFVCGLLQRITGFDRTYYCELDLDGNGLVSGEHNTGVLPSLMDHRFPASDIPASVRPIYVKNRFRSIADARADRVPLSAAPEGDDADLDLTHSLSRYPAATHLIYLSHMGVRSSSSFSVVRDGRLAALFGGHCVLPRVLRYRQLAACQQLVETYAYRHAALEAERTERRRDAKRSLVHSAVAKLVEVDGSLARLLEAAAPDLCSLTDADGVIGRVDGVIYTSGGLAERDAAAVLDCAQAQLRDREVWSTDSLAETDPALGAVAAHASGAMAIGLDRGAANLLVWTRVEQPRDRRWSGNPSKAVVADGRGGVGPRQSFATWLETVSGTSRAWSAEASTIATLFRDRVNQTLAAHYQRLALAAAEQANAHKSQFIANVSHELRTPLHSILGFTEVVRNRLDTMPVERQLTMLDSVLRSGQRLLGLVDDILDLSRLEAGQMTFRFQPGTLVDAIDRAVADASARLEAKQLRVTVDLAGVDPDLTFDLPRTVQVLVNLLANAAHASAPAGEILVRLHDRADAEPPGVCLEVADHGVGIPAHQLEHIFDKFVQGDRTANGPGTTGLGLAICREIVASHGGRIWAANRPSGGASLCFQYPRHLAASKP
jgi:light-regulated signal transduction histidine kinase (bacteriophytochrome)